MGDGQQLGIGVGFGLATERGIGVGKFSTHGAGIRWDTKRYKRWVIWAQKDKDGAWNDVGTRWD